MYTAVRHHHSSTAETIIRHTEGKIKSADMKAVIFDTAKAGFTDIIKLSLANRLLMADELKSLDSIGRTLLHYSAERGRVSNM